MDFLLIAVLFVWSIASCFLPLAEKRLRALGVINAFLLALALFALAVPAIQGASSSAFFDLLIIDRMRGLLLIPLAISWIAIALAFAVEWKERFAQESGARSLYCVKSFGLVFAFFGVFTVLLSHTYFGAIAGAFVTICTILVGTLFHELSHEKLEKMRLFNVGLAAAFVCGAMGCVCAIVGNFVRVGNLGDMLLRGAVACGVFAALWIAGLLPGLAWYQRGVACLSRGYRVLFRVLLPVAFFSHVFAFLSWSGTGGESFMRKIILLATVFAAGTLVYQLRIKASFTESIVTFCLFMILSSLSFGPAGAIPALMLLEATVLFGTACILAQGGLAWTSRKKVYAVGILAVPFVSPFFVPYALSMGYGIQMMPKVACLISVLVLYTLFSFAKSLLRAWSEDELRFSDIANGHIAFALCLILTVYGCWFMYTDTLSLFVDAISGT